jgi:hypothetical protein
MRSGVLSEPASVETISSRFVPCVCSLLSFSCSHITLPSYALNVTLDGFEQCTRELPGLRHLQRAYATNWRFAYGFASCVILTSDGQHPLAWTSAVRTICHLFHAPFHSFVLAQGTSRELPAFLEFLSCGERRSGQYASMRNSLAAGNYQSAMTDLSALLREAGAELALRMAQARPPQP